jgi:hypothetical protein
MPKAGFHSRMTRVRLLTLFLLGSLAWGATAEVIHGHGTQLTARSVQFQKTTASNSSTASQTRASNPDPRGTSPSSDQCLICQLHQNLSAALFGPTLQIAAADALRVTATIKGIPTLSGSALMHQGRAPPSYL